MQNYCKHIYLYLLLVIGIGSLISCGGSPTPSTTEGEQPLARVYDVYLYPEDIEGVGSGVPPKDSIYQVKMHIEKWINDQLLVRTAKQNINKKNDYIERRVRDFRTSLILEYYEQNLIGERLDSVVTAAQISDYYTKNKEQYQSGIDWIRCHFVKIKREVEGIDEVRKLFKSESGMDFERVKLFCAEHKDKTVYVLDEDKWIKLDNVRRQVPENMISTRYIDGDRILDRSDDNHQYLLKIFEFKGKDDALPLSQVQEQISRIILHQRSAKLLRDIRKELYLKGKKEANFEIY
ncbi:MAG: hypothetical protein MK212_03380 [Saprospiraceae bacterium]|nr:hypothetical protein [Saprospiraceae bacterium]